MWKTLEVKRNELTAESMQPRLQGCGSLKRSPRMALTPGAFLPCGQKSPSVKDSALHFLPCEAVLSWGSLTSLGRVGLLLLYASGIKRALVASKEAEVCFSSPVLLFL